jgi:hypothetical protein
MQEAAARDLDAALNKLKADAQVGTVSHTRGGLASATAVTASLPVASSSPQGPHLPPQRLDSELKTSGGVLTKGIAESRTALEALGDLVGGWDSHVV